MTSPLLEDGMTTQTIASAVDTIKVTAEDNWNDILRPACFAMIAPVGFSFFLGEWQASHTHNILNRQQRSRENQGSNDRHEALDYKFCTSA